MLNEGLSRVCWLGAAVWVGTLAGGDAYAQEGDPETELVETAVQLVCGSAKTPRRVARLKFFAAYSFVVDRYTIAQVQGNESPMVIDELFGAVCGEKLDDRSVTPHVFAAADFLRDHNSDRRARFRLDSQQTDEDRVIVTSTRGRQSIPFERDASLTVFVSDETRSTRLEIPLRVSDVQLTRDGFLSAFLLVRDCTSMVRVSGTKSLGETFVEHKLCTSRPAEERRANRVYFARLAAEICGNGRTSDREWVVDSQLLVQVLNPSNSTDSLPASAGIRGQIDARHGLLAAREAICGPARPTRGASSKAAEEVFSTDGLSKAIASLASEPSQIPPPLVVVNSDSQGFYLRTMAGAAQSPRSALLLVSRSLTFKIGFVGPEISGAVVVPLVLRSLSVPPIGYGPRAQVQTDCSRAASLQHPRFGAISASSGVRCKGASAGDARRPRR